MTYDGGSPQMNIEAARVPSDPHAILSEIADIDTHIENKQAQRRELVQLYQHLMEGFEKHAAQVLYRPEQGEEVPHDTAMVKASGRNW